MKNYKIIIGLFALTIIGNGCCSYMVYQNSQQKIKARKIREFIDAETKDNEDAEKAIKAYRLGDDGFGIGVDLLNIEALKEQPVKQGLAALLDAGIIWATTEAYKAIDKANEDINDNKKDKNYGTSINITINGDENRTQVTYTEGTNNDSNGDKEDDVNK